MAEAALAGLACDQRYLKQVVAADQRTLLTLITRPEQQAALVEAGMLEQIVGLATSNSDASESSSGATLRKEALATLSKLSQTPSYDARTSATPGSSKSAFMFSNLPPFFRR